MKIYGQKTSKMPQNWGFSPICDPLRFIFKNWAVTFVLLWCPNFKQKIKQILKAVSEIFKDERTNRQMDQLTDMGDYIGPPWVNAGSKIRKN